MELFGYHPVLDMHSVNQLGNYERHMAVEDQNAFDTVGAAIDGTPRVVAALALGSLAALFLLKRAGFRFVVGVNVGK